MGHIIYSLSFIDLCQPKRTPSLSKESNINYNHPVCIFSLRTSRKAQLYKKSSAIEITLCKKHVRVVLGDLVI